MKDIDPLEALALKKIDASNQRTHRYEYGDSCFLQGNYVAYAR
jgi:hypothetical protein